MAKCECQWLSWIPKCYGHCKIKQAQLQDLSAAKDDEPEVEDVPKIKPEEEDAPKIKPEVEDVPKIKPGADLSDDEVAEEDVSAAKDDEVTTSSSRCECYTGHLKSPLSKGFKCARFAHCPNAAATVQAEPAQLLDLSTSWDVEVVQCNTKSAAQVFMEEKVEKTKTKQKIEAKLALLKKEVKMGQQLLQQTKTLLEGKEALVKRKVRVTYNQCHKFWRGHVIFAHKSDVDEQVDAAKTRLGLGKSGIKFNISAMVEKIDKLAPGARYKSANPQPPSSATSTSRPRFKTFVPRRSPPSPRRTRSLAIPAPPVLSKSSASAWYRGDHCIVYHGDSIAQDLCYDEPTQIEYCDDGHEDQVDDSFICEDCASVGAKELEVGCHDAKEDEVEYYDAKEDEVESDNVEMVGFNIAEESTAWYRGDQCIDSHGDSIAEDVCFDDPTQLEQSDDEFLWDGNHDFASHAEDYYHRCWGNVQNLRT